MKIRIDDSCFDLRKHQIMRFDGASGVALVCLRGKLWLTQDGDLRDIVLAAGDRFRLDGEGLKLVSALQASSLCLEMPSEPRPVRRESRPSAPMAISGVRAAAALPFAISPQ